MTNWDDIARRRERQAATSDTLMNRLWQRFQLAAWPELETVIGAMAVDKAGRITFTLSNLQRAQRVGVVVSAVYRRTMRRTVIDFLVGAFRKLFKLNTDYAKEMGNVTETAEQRVLTRLLRFYGYQDGEVLPNTLFAALDPDNGLTADISRRVQGAIAQRMPLEQFRQQFRKEFVNPKSGFAARYYRRWTNDLMMQFDRGVGMAYADELGLNYAIWAHTIIETTRNHCYKCANRVFSRSFIAKMNDEQWAGKHTYLPVEYAQGGFRCRGTFNYISDELAKVIGEQRGGIDVYGPNLPPKTRRRRAVAN
jgi:hypothetical protein